MSREISLGTKAFNESSPFFSSQQERDTGNTMKKSGRRASFYGNDLSFYEFDNKREKYIKITSAKRRRGRKKILYLSPSSHVFERQGQGKHF